MREELDEGLKWTQWQVLQRRSLNQYRKELSELANIAFEEIYPIAEEELERSYTEASNEWENEWQKLPQAVKQKPVDFASRFKTKVDTDKINTIDKAIPQAFSVQPIDSEESFFNFNKEKLKQVIEDNKSDIDVARYSAVNYSFSQYKDILQKVDIAMQTGTYTLDQAVDKASKEFANRGINSIEYKDGRRVNISTYIEMCLRTSSHRAKLQAEGAWRDRTGNYLVVSADLKTTCDICYKWQVVVLIDDVFAHGKADGKHQLLSEAIRDGFLHPNCRHSLNTYFEGITRVPNKSEFDKTKSNYEAERKQRQLELQIRRAKRQEAIAITEEEQIKAQLNVIAWQKKLKKHLKDNPQLKRYPQRERLLDLTPFEKYKNDPERAIKEVSENIKRDLEKQPKLYAKADGKPYRSVKNEWLEEAKYRERGKVTELNYWEVDGERYDVDGVKVELSYSEKERKVAEFLSESLNADLKMVPKVNNPEGIRTPDYLLNGERFDLKSLSGKGKYVIDNNVKRLKGQSENAVFDITECPLDVDEIFNQLSLVYLDVRRKLNVCIILKDNEIIDIIKRDQL